MQNDDELTQRERQLLQDFVDGKLVAKPGTARRGRPPKPVGERRSVTVTLRMTLDESMRLDELVERFEADSRSACVRHLVDQAYVDASIEDATAEGDEAAA